MTDTTPCPNPRDLRRLAFGDLLEGEVEPLEQHLLACPRCAVALSSLDADDSLVRALRVGPGAQLPDQPGVSALVERLVRISPTLDVATPAPSSSRLPTPNALPLGPGTSPPSAHIGRYEVLGQLGAGGMGTVYRANDPQLRRVVAIKVPRFDGSPEARAQAAHRFLREARAAAAVHHPNVCPIHDVGAQDGVPYVVLALVEGETLAERLARQGRFDDCSEAVALIEQVSAGLGAVHEAGIVHRDLKPGNVLLDRTGRPLLTDFGLARIDRDSSHLTADGSLLGTPAYMAPEQVTLDLGGVGPWSDQYSLAVVLYQMLTGHLPFTGHYAALLNQIATKAPPPPSAHRLELDPQLELLVLKAMARHPKERYPTAVAFGAALDVWRKTRTSQPGQATQRFINPVQPVREGGTGSFRPLGRRSGVVVGSGLALLLLGAIAWVSWRPENGGTEGTNLRQGERSESLKQGERPGAPAGPLVVQQFRIVQRESASKTGSRALGTIGKELFEVPYGALVSVEVELSEDVYGYLLAFNTDGSEQLIWPANEKNEADRTVPPPRARFLKCPARAERDGSLTLFKLDDNRAGGMQVLGFVASRKALPAYNAWSRQRGEIGWQPTPAGEAVWVADAKGVHPVGPVLGVQRGSFVKVAGTAPLLKLSEELLRAPGVDGLELWAFPVLAKEK